MNQNQSSSHLALTQIIKIDEEEASSQSSFCNDQSQTLSKDSSFNATLLSSVNRLRTNLAHES